MPRLSILVPACKSSDGLEALLGALLVSKDLDLNVIVSGSQEITARFDDKRLITLPATTADRSEQDIWNALIDAATGDWVTLVKPDDMIEPELAIIVAFLSESDPAADALSWNSLQIDAEDAPGRPFSVAIPSKYGMINLDKAAMINAFFMWENSSHVPRMPFGLYHGALKTTLAKSIAQNLRTSGRVSPLPAYEWSARAILMAKGFTFCERPLSVIAKVPFAADPQGKPAKTFVFHAGIGQSAGIAEVQHGVFAETGIQWDAGAEAAFVRAAMIDCMVEPDQEIFAARCEAYYKAFKRWKRGRYVRQFQPQFKGPQPPDIRRGLHGNMLMVDRFIGNARTAQEFYRVMRAFLVPVAQICNAGVADAGSSLAKQV